MHVYFLHRAANTVFLPGTPDAFHKQKTHRIACIKGVHIYCRKQFDNDLFTFSRFPEVYLRSHKLTYIVNIKIPVLLFSAFFWSTIANAQSGCTDSQASNYNPSVTTNDGSCIYPATHKSPVLKGAFNSIIHESSGLEWTDGKLWTHNDSGNPAEIYQVDTTDGHTIQTVAIDNYPLIDWEDITADSSYIYIGDHGNNDGTRTDLKVLKIKKSDITTSSTVHVNAQAISFSYSDQTSFASSHTNNFDCEALMSIGDSLYIITKDRGDLETRVYKMPKTPGTYALTPYTSYNVNGLITGADYNAVTHQVVLIGYLSGHTNSFLWYLSDFQNDMFFSGNKRRIEIGNGAEWQTEGVCWVSNNHIFISCEDTGPPPAFLYSCDDIFTTTTGIGKFSGSMPYNIAPNPATNVLLINDVNTAGVYQVMNLNGQAMLAGKLNTGSNNIDIRSLAPGNYFVELKCKNGNIASLKFEKK